MRAVAVFCVLGLALFPFTFLPGGSDAAGSDGRATDAVAFPSSWTIAATADDGLTAPPVPAVAFAEAISAPLRSPADVVDAAGAITDAATQMLASSPGVSVVAAAASATDTFSGFSSVTLQGDATGDGKSDVLVIQYPFEEVPTDAEAHTIRMLDAPAGVTVWTRELPTLFLGWVGDVDLDGDGLTDVAAVTLTYDGDPVEQQGVVVQKFEWRLVALRGLDGAVLWETTESWAFAYGPTGPLAGTLFSPALFFLAVIGPDANGDGGMDVWLNVFDGGERRLPDGSYVDGGVRRVVLLSGATGLPFGAAALPGGPGGADFVFPTGDMTGDGLADSTATWVPTRTFVAGATVTSGLVAGAEGKTGRPLWVRPFGGSFALGLPFPDMDGDAASDLVTVVVAPGGIVSLEALSGADGATLWKIVDPLFLGVAVGGLDDVPGSDMVFLDGDTDGLSLSPHLVGISGADGTVLYDTHPFSVPLPANGYASVEFRILAGDFDGDGAQDHILNAENGVFPERFLSDIHVVRSRDGADHRAFPGSDHFGIRAADLTGDGFDDLFRLVIDLEPFALHVSAVDVDAAGTLWTRTIADVQGVQLVPGGDVAGSDAYDLVVSTAVGDGGLPTDEGPVTVIHAWDGPTGSLLWAAG